MHNSNLEYKSSNTSGIVYHSGGPIPTNQIGEQVMSTGIKKDDGKPRLDLLSTIALTEIAKVMTFGAKKYDAHNWRGGFKYSRLIAAILRHVLAYNGGEKLDPETGISHLAHAGCGIMFLLEFEVTGAGEDDLYKPKAK